MLYTIWYHLHNLKNVKNSHGGMLLWVKLQAEACIFSKSNILHDCFSRFLNCANDTKSRKASHLYFQNGSIQLQHYSQPSQILKWDKWTVIKLPNLSLSHFCINLNMKTISNAICIGGQYFLLSIVMIYGELLKFS